MNINRVNLVRKGELQFGNKPNKIILHHPVFNGTVEQLNQEMINSGFSMIGYNYYVRKDGTVWEGRPVDAIGGNCYGQNACSIGVAFEGDFMIDTMSNAQLNSGIELCKFLMQQYPGIKEIGPHGPHGSYKGYYNTACPGTNFPVDQMIAAVMNGSAPSPANPVPQSNILKLWSTGDAVKDLQTKLNKLGYKLTVDGIFGQNTYNAAEHFQASKGLTVDGVAGPQTMAALNAAISNIGVIDIHTYKYLQHEVGAAEDNIPGPETLSKCPLIKFGANSNIVKWIQTKLGISADGVFGRQTLIAIQNFQARYGLTADGVIGQQTWKKLLGL